MSIRTGSTRTNNSVYNPKSRYVQGGTTDKHPTKLGWWERRIIPKDESDITIEIQPNEDRRPDLIAYNIYGQSSLAWVVLQYNNIVDIETELRTGRELRLPSERRLKLDILNRSPGGKRV